MGVEAVSGDEALPGDAEIVPPPPREPEGSDEGAAGRGPRVSRCAPERSAAPPRRRVVTVRHPCSLQACPRRRRKGARTLPGPEEEEEGQEDTQG